MISAFNFWIDILSKICSWIFSLEICKNPSITLGVFLVSCATIGLVLYFILGTDFFPVWISSERSYSDNYVPRHARGNAGLNYSTRVSRHK